MGIVKTLLQNMWVKAMGHNQANILRLFEQNPSARFLDLGCDDGEWTIKCASAVGTKTISGVDIVRQRLGVAESRGIETTHANLDEEIPLPDGSFDVIHANQVIEHVSSIDHFAREIHRLLKPGAYAVISTENASSWCNVAAMMMGWQMFSLTNLSSVHGGIGNPMAIHRGENVELSSWTHKTIFAYRGLIEFFKAHKFEFVQIQGAGYFPLPTVCARVDVRHAHFITIKIRKGSPKSV